ncbi:unnamed protein product [Phaedon cochleariae]|uniref:PIN domain-containing protein n=1 Tax=Phaedon cochleariae TaxID=80249 RepID=A0A9P0DKR3_PHACE|nr:unnamed protein product [Phaedon cochleariae]
MSHRTGENRTILKARRFNKFQSTSAAIANYVPDNLINTTTTTSEILGKHGLKRNRDEVNVSIPKKMCNGLQVSLGTARNLANNRLQRLKGSLKADLEQKINSGTETGETVMTSSNGSTVGHLETFSNYNEPSKSQTPVYAEGYSIPETSSNIRLQNLDKWTTPPPAKTRNTLVENSFISVRETNEYAVNSSNSHTKAFQNFNEPYNSERSLIKDSHSTSLTSPKNIYKNLDKWANSSNNYQEKNFANQRLNRLKRVVNDLKSNVELVSNNNNCGIQESPLKSQVNNDGTMIHLNKEHHGSLHNRVSGLKRNADYSESEVACSPIKKSSPLDTLSCLATNNKWTEDSSRLKACSSEAYNLLSPNINNKKGNNNFSSPERSGLNTLKATNVSNRIMKIKKNMETINTTLYHDQSPVMNYDQKVCYNTPRNCGKLKSSENLKHDKNGRSGHDCFKKSINDSQGSHHDNIKEKARNFQFNTTTNKIYECSGSKSNTNSDNFAKSTNESQIINSNRNTQCNISQQTGILDDLTLDHFLESSKHQDSASPCKTSSEANNFDNYKGKWKMTATWVWNHQNMNGTPDQPESVVVSEIVAEPISKREDHIDDTEEMEWTNAEPDSDQIETQTEIEIRNSADEEAKNLPKQKSKELCIIVDTNVFISGLSRIKDIMNLKITEPTSLIIYVPWMVITELDYMKHSCSDDKLKQKVTSAIKFINTALENKNPRFLGQTIHDMEQQKSIGISPDDKIVSCCLQANQKYETVILLSNDLNLRSKAMINNISATSANEIIMKILSKTTKTAKSQKIMQKMSMLCSSVICDCAKDTYGDVWSKMDLLSSPPWSLKECLKRFRKYWPTVFQDKVMKQFTMVVDQLLAIFHKNRYFADDSEDYVKFMKLCINLCIFLKDIQQCRGSVENTLRDITKI